MNHIGRMLRSYREKNKKRLSELSIMIGYKNVNKGIRRLQDIEKNPSRYNKEDMKIIHKIMEVFSIPKIALDMAIDEDDRESVIKSNNILSYSGNPYIIIRYAPAFYLQYSVPRELYSDSVLTEKYVCGLAKEKNVYICLVYPNKYEVWVDKNGEIYSRSDCSSPENCFVDNFKPIIN